MRIKDFEFLASTGSGDGDARNLIVTGSSDGSIRIWSLERAELEENVSLTNGLSDAASARIPETNGKDEVDNGPDKDPAHQVGKLLGTHESGNRITCLTAFTMLDLSGASQTGVDDGWADEFDGIAGSGSESSNSTSS